MKAAIYARVGDKDQFEPETDAKKKEQEFEIYCERLKQRAAGGYILQKQSERIKKSR